jgi:hypothetical protein
MGEAFLGIAGWACTGYHSANFHRSYILRVSGADATGALLSVCAPMTAGVANEICPSMFNLHACRSRN